MNKNGFYKPRDEKKNFKKYELAIKSCDLELCKKLIEQKVPFNYVDKYKRPVLFSAINQLSLVLDDSMLKGEKKANAIKKLIDIMQLFLNHGAQSSGALLYAVKRDCYLALLVLNKHFKYNRSLLKIIHRDSAELAQHENNSFYNLGIKRAIIKQGKIDKEEIFRKLNYLSEYDGFDIRNIVEQFVEGKETTQTYEEELKEAIVNDNIAKLDSFSKNQILSCTIEGKTPLCYALENNSNKAMSKLIDLGANINSELDDSDSLVYNALSKGKVELARTLIKMGATIDSDETMKKILKLNDINIVELLLSSNKWNRTSPQIVLALNSALEQDDDLLCNLILDNLEIIHHSLLDEVILTAVKKQNINALKKLFAAGANANIFHEKKSSLRLSDLLRGVEYETSEKTVLAFLEAGCFPYFGVLNLIQSEFYCSCLEFLVKNYNKYILHKINDGYFSENFLHEAIRINGDEEKRIKFINLLLDSGADASKPYKADLTTFYTPTFLAHYFNREKVIELLSSKVKTTKEEREQIILDCKLLHLIESKDEIQPEQVENLIKQGANVKLVDYHHNSLLVLALKNKHFNILSTLIKNGAAQKDYYYFIKELMGLHRPNNNDQQLALDNVLQCHSLLEPGFITAFSSSYCSERNPSIIQRLIKLGMDVNEKIESATPLLCAVSKNNKKVAQTLINSGADINAFYTNTNNVSYSPLMIAAVKANPDLVKLLIELGADINATNEEGDNALTILFNKKCYCNLPYGLEDYRNSNVYERSWIYDLFDCKHIYDIYGSAPLINDYDEIIYLLIKAGIDVDHKNNKGENIANCLSKRKIKDLMKKKF